MLVSSWGVCHFSWMCRFCLQSWEEIFDALIWKQVGETTEILWNFLDIFRQLFLSQQYMPLSPARQTFMPCSLWCWWSQMTVLWAKLWIFGWYREKHESRRMSWVPNFCIAVIFKTQWKVLFAQDDMQHMDWPLNSFTCKWTSTLNTQRKEITIANNDKRKEYFLVYVSLRVFLICIDIIQHKRWILILNCEVFSTITAFWRPCLQCVILFMICKSCQLHQWNRLLWLAETSRDFLIIFHLFGIISRVSLTCWTASD